MPYRISVDTGGTFTDVVVTDEKGQFTVGKALTDKQRAFASIEQGIKVAAEELGIESDALLKDPEYLPARHNLGLLYLRTGEHDRAEKDLAAELKRSWRAPLVRLYGLVESSEPERQLKRAEDWLRNHSEDPDLLLAAARLCLRLELWGKARSYLETVIALRPTPDAYQEYGRLLTQLGEGEAAADAYREGLNLAAGSDRLAIPHLEEDK